jgi:alpha-tubulin suppressor-like RCC1 family protein
VSRHALPTPVEALRGVRVGIIAAVGFRSYAAADTGELWAWGMDGDHHAPLGHGEEGPCPMPKLIELLRGIKVNAVAAGCDHMLALADDGSVYAWDDALAAESGALGLGPSVRDAQVRVPTPQPRRSASRGCVWRVGCDGDGPSQHVAPPGARQLKLI